MAHTIKTIAITGKGGTGKTMLATLMIRLLTGRFEKILAIDADSAMSLPYTLGLEVKSTVSEMRKGIAGSAQLKKQLADKTAREIMSGLLTRGPGFELMAMGRPEEPGCFCAVNDLLRYGIDRLIGDYDIAVIDGEAGPEQINRRVMENIDLLLVVADMSRRSLETASGIVRIAKNPGEDSLVSVKRAGLVLNRVRDDKPDRKLLDKVGVEVLGWIPEDATLNEYDRIGKSLLELPDDSPCVAAVCDMLPTILTLNG